MKRFKQVFGVLLLVVMASFSCTTVDDNNNDSGNAQSFVFDDFPETSWDYVNTHAHLHKLGDSDNLTEQEAEFLATKYKFVTLEKQHGNRTEIGAEVEIYTAAKMIKKYNPNSKVLLYRSRSSDYGRYMSTGAVLVEDEYRFWNTWNAGFTEYVSAFDYRQEVVQEYVKESVSYWCRTGVIDGFYSDSYGGLNTLDGSIYEMLGEEEYEKYVQGVFDTFDAILEENPGTISIGNGVKAGSIPNLDEDIITAHVTGGMIDHFANYGYAEAASIAADIEIMLYMERIGKICVVKAWPRYDAQNDPDYLTEQEREAVAREDIVFPLACFLMGAYDYSYFCYSWQWGTTSGWLIDYDEYNKPLGKPLGDYTKDGWNYYREFEHAKAWANLETGEAEIIWDVDN